tara:strand:- start:1745 stop:1915 length:171 start_codon:yes stop_codon:yes gene_type:complete
MKKFRVTHFYHVWKNTIVESEDITALENGDYADISEEKIVEESFMGIDLESVEEIE